MADEKPLPSLTQIPAAALPKFGFDPKQARALEGVQKSPEAVERRTQEEQPAQNQANFAKFLYETGRINEGDGQPNPGISVPRKPGGRRL